MCRVHIDKEDNTKIKLLNSKPCVNCLKYLKKLNCIKYVIYTNEEGEWVKEKLKDLNNDFISYGVRNCSKK